MRIVLTGATGFLGFRTLERLVEQPEIESIVATGRTLRPDQRVSHPKVEYRLGDLCQLNFVEALLIDATHVIHAAALSSPWGNYELFESANLISQQHLIQVAKKHSIERYVFISTPSLYFNMRNRLNIHESDPLPVPFINSYAKTKRLAEIALETSSIPFVILRPRALIGRGDSVIMPRLIRAYDEGRLKIIGSGENIADLTSVANVADAIWLSLIANEEALNETYNISNGSPVRLWDAIADVLRKLGKVPPKKKIPFGLVKFIAGIMEFYSRMTTMKEPTLTQYGVGTLSKSLTMDISKARALLKYNPRVTTEEAINEFVKWYQEHEEG